jgi:3',5'-cyclic AMP phosphodiesterase CpdA
MRADGQRAPWSEALQQKMSWPDPSRLSPPGQDKNSPEPMVGVDRRFVKFGGGVSDAQLDWLRLRLAEAAAAGQRVVVFCHLPLHPSTCAPACLLWNYEAVLPLLQASGVVVATLAGHTHQARAPCFPVSMGLFLVGFLGGASSRLSVCRNAWVGCVVHA